MKHLSFLVCLLGGLALPTCAQDRPPTVEIFLQSDGDLHLRPAADRRANTNKNNSAKNDTLIRFHQQEQETKVFTRTQPKGQRHDPLRIDVPAGSVVDLRAQRGTVLAQGLQGHLMGSMQGGSLTLRELRGSVELVSEQGDIHLSDSQVEGLLLARKGNITLQDSPGGLSTYAPEGKMRLLIGEGYYKLQPKALDIDMEVGEITVSQAPYGGQIALRQGTLKVSQIEKPLQVQGAKTTVELFQVAAPVRVTNRGTVKVQISPKFPLSKQPLQFRVSGGDLELSLPRDFEATYQLRLIETNPKEAQASVRSVLDLGKAKVRETKNKEKDRTIRETIYGGTIGKGGTPLDVHITNGRLIINRY